jgi:Inner membrane protein CreD
MGEPIIHVEPSSFCKRSATMARLVQIGLIWFGCALAWMVLGSSLVVRSGDASSSLTRDVHQLWGTPIDQRAPNAFYEEPAAPGAPTPKNPPAVVHRDVPLDASHVHVQLDLEQRKKGLEWFPTYAVDFRARYTFENPSAASERVTFQLPLQGDGAVYDDFAVTVEHGAAVRSDVHSSLAAWSAVLAPGARRTFKVSYRSRGTTSFRYDPSDGAEQVRDFTFEAGGNFAAVDFAPGSISPSSEGTTHGHWHGEWRFKNLVAAAPIAIELPGRLNPGPFASRVTFFAPIGLLFFFFVVAILAAAQGRAIHPLNYFFFGCGFFAFHLLFAYLVDHVALVPSFAVATAVALALNVTYARLFMGWRFALVELGLAQLIYLVLFSSSFFWAGFTGLAITVGAIVTLAVMMQITGRTDWCKLGKSESQESPAPS